VVVRILSLPEAEVEWVIIVCGNYDVGMASSRRVLNLYFRFFRPCRGLQVRWVVVPCSVLHMEGVGVHFLLIRFQRLQRVRIISLSFYGKPTLKAEQHRKSSA
jgi:hypothetical protein